mmetsp:Transcript_124918/g.388881  ORF Transcript_124918/g.388881 Transcript_124918/m.388881 type:complete len:491 (-) Transcript_124918:30-1502(-)
MANNAAPMRRRARTIEAPRQELDMMVLQFSCHDESAFTAIGKNCKEMKWKIGAMGTEPVDIILHVEKLPGRSPEVSITADSKKLFPLGGKNKEKLKTDFQQKWPFRGVAKDVDKKNFFEIKPKGVTDDWLPAIWIRHRDDGSGKFQARVWCPDPNSTKPKEVDLLAVDKEDIRERESKKPLVIPVRELILDVCKEDPLKESTLSLIDEKGSEEVTHFFARPTPAPSGTTIETMPTPNQISMEVNKERTRIKIAAGHDQLVHYLSSEARGISTAPESATKISWSFQIGPTAQHTVSLEKKFKGSKIVTLTVDGKVLIEAAASDFDLEVPEGDTQSSTSAGWGPWCGAFRLIGQRSVKAKVFEQNQEGTPLETTDLVEVLPEKEVKYTKTVRVRVSDQKDLRSAVLDIDGVDFASLKPAAAVAETSMEVEPEVLKMQYNLDVPTKVREVPPTALQAMQSKLKEAGQQWQEGWEKAQPGLQELGQKFGALFKS